MASYCTYWNVDKNKMPHCNCSLCDDSETIRIQLFKTSNNFRISNSTAFAEKNICTAKAFYSFTTKNLRHLTLCCWKSNESCTNNFVRPTLLQTTWLPPYDLFSSSVPHITTHITGHEAKFALPFGWCFPPNLRNRTVLKV